MYNYIIKLNSEEAEIIQEVLDYFIGAGMTVSEFYRKTLEAAIKQDEGWGENGNNDLYAEEFRKAPTEYKIERADDLFFTIRRQLGAAKHGRCISRFEKETVLTDMEAYEY